jgi:serine/threonine/tyrosine protein kinase RAD53
MGWFTSSRRRTTASTSESDVLAGSTGRASSAPSFTGVRTYASRESTGSAASTASIEDYYTLHEPLGSGAFATVHRAVERGTGRTVAVKVIRARESLPPSSSLHVDAEREYHLNCRLQKASSRLSGSTEAPPPFAQPHASFVTDTEYCMVLDYLSGGNVEEWLAAHGEPSPTPSGPRVMREADAKVVMLRALQGIRTMHKLNMAHCDIKPANLVRSCHTARLFHRPPNFTGVLIFYLSPY